MVILIINQLCKPICSRIMFIGIIQMYKKSCFLKYNSVCNALRHNLGALRKSLKLEKNILKSKRKGKSKAKFFIVQILHN